MVNLCHFMETIGIVCSKFATKLVNKYDYDKSTDRDFDDALNP